jgi:hypothetical protein
VGPKGPWEVFGAPIKTPIHYPLHFIVYFYNKTRSIYEFNVDKNGGKISEFRFLQKVLKLVFPKVYFFGCSKKPLLPISQNPKIAAIFCRISNKVLFVVASRFAKDRRSDRSAPPQGPKARSLTIIQYKSYCIILCSNSL